MAHLCGHRCCHLLPVMQCISYENQDESQSPCSCLINESKTSIKIAPLPSQGLHAWLSREAQDDGLQGSLCLIRIVYLHGINSSRILDRCIVYQQPCQCDLLQKTDTYVSSKVTGVNEERTYCHQDKERHRRRACHSSGCPKSRPDARCRTPCRRQPV